MGTRVPYFSNFNKLNGCYLANYTIFTTMIDTTLIEKLVTEHLANSDMFVVEIKKTPSNEIEITIDSDSSVGIESCVEISKMVEATLDREAEDFELTVISAGVGQPLKMLRQYKKLIGQEVDLLFADGIKLIATLKDATSENITVAYEEKITVEGKKRKEVVTTEKTVALSELKSTKEHISFK